MGSDVFAPLAFFGFLSLVVVMPLYFRHKRNLKTIDVVALALEKNVDPEAVLRVLPAQRDGGDINGNWKAGKILIWLGIVFGVLMMSAVGASEEMQRDAGLTPLIPAGISIALGTVLLSIHRRIVGPVRTAEQLQSGDGPGA